nr:autophagy protein 16 [Quercus suber]
MADWLAIYSASLSNRDLHEQAHKSYIDAYTALADRTATAIPPSPDTITHTGPTDTPTRFLPSKFPGDKSGSLSPSTLDPLSALRADLATTQHARSVLAQRVEDLTRQLARLESAATASTTTIAVLTRQKAELERRLRDREEELRVKGRLVVQAQDEQVALELQLHFAEKREAEAKTENEELVARWMERMGREAEMVNRESRWE